VPRPVPVRFQHHRLSASKMVRSLYRECSSTASGGTSLCRLKPHTIRATSRRTDADLVVDRPASGVREGSLYYLPCFGAQGAGPKSLPGWRTSLSSTWSRRAIPSLLDARFGPATSHRARVMHIVRALARRHCLRSSAITVVGLRSWRGGERATAIAATEGGRFRPRRTTVRNYLLALPRATQGQQGIDVSF
jgi:hypothetical protein